MSDLFTIPASHPPALATARARYEAAKAAHDETLFIEGDDYNPHHVKCELRDATAALARAEREAMEGRR